MDSQRQKCESVASRRSFRRLPVIKQHSVIKQSVRPASDSHANSTALFGGFDPPLATCCLVGQGLKRMAAFSTHSRCSSQLIRRHIAGIRER